MFAASLALVLLAVPVPPKGAADLSTARGLDVFVFGAREAPGGSALPLSVRVLGFTTATRLVGVSDAEVELRWDPDSVGAELPAVPARTDSDGRAQVLVPVPRGPTGKLVLLIRAAHRGRERTETLRIERRAEAQLRLELAETGVVPGGATTAWAERVGASRGDQVRFELLEGRFSRWTATAPLGPGARARVVVPIPKTRARSVRWWLRATLLDAGAPHLVLAEDEVALTLRAEVPGRPRLALSLSRAVVAPGETAQVTVQLTDAVGRPVTEQPLRFWRGPPSLAPKTPRAWVSASTATRSPSRGSLVLPLEAPRAVLGGSAQLRLEVETSLDGHALHEAVELRVERPSATVELRPEGPIFPGSPSPIELRVADPEGRAVSGRFAVRGDGLDAIVTTDERGEGRVAWTPPRGVGAHHPSGACAEDVAATLVVRPLDGLAERLGRDRFDRCVRVDRARRLRLVASPVVARAGSAVQVTLEGAPRERVQVLATAEDGRALGLVDVWGTGAWTVPEDARGPVTLTAARDALDGPAELATTRLLVAPRTLGRVEAKVARAPARPGDEAELDVWLRDERGAALQGWIGGFVSDERGGGGSRVAALDTRRALAAGLDLGLDEPGRARREDELLDGAPTREPWRRAVLFSAGSPERVEPHRDPAADVERRWAAVFRDVVRSLEGAILQATQEPDRLADVRRPGPGGDVLNPELLTLVTAAMETPPLTPGGEPVTLEDLMARDPQVRFERVARRVARLQLFRVLEAVRSYVYERRLLPDERLASEPRVLLRKLVESQKLAASALVDPWGGAIGFVPSRAPGPPHLALVRGFALHAAGPDRVLGTADDVRDPFERVLRSGTPYAQAVDEDRLVDAAYEAVVGDDTVDAWRALLERLTGTTLGNLQEELDIGGEGSGGSGYGNTDLGGRGEGMYRVFEADPARAPLVPLHTDAQGHVPLRVPTGPDETTWRVTVVAWPDPLGTARPGPAATEVLLPVALPLSTQLVSGRRWTVGDQVEVEIRTENHTELPRVITVSLRADPGLMLPRADETLRLAPGARSVRRVRVEARQAGETTLTVVTTSPGIAPDSLTRPILVGAPLTPGVVATTRWVEGRLPLTLDGPQAPELAAGPARLELTRGVEAIVRVALEALDPDHAARPQGERTLAELVELAARVQRAGPSARAERLGRLARARLDGARPDARPSTWAEAVRRRLALAAPDESPPPPECPGALEPIEVLELEPAFVGAPLACWDVAVSNAVATLAREARAAELARATLALTARAHRRVLLEALPFEAAAHAPGALVDDATRVLVEAARALKSRNLGPLLQARRADGAFGSVAASRAAIDVLLELAPPASPDAASPAVGVSDGQGSALIPLARGATISVPVSPGTIEVDARGAPVLATLRQPTTRPWIVARPAQPGPLDVEVRWPSVVAPGSRASVTLRVRHIRAVRTRVELRLPLPPGVEVRALPDRGPGLGVEGAILEDALSLVLDVEPGATPRVVEVPIACALGGQVAVPEGEAWLVDVDEAPTPLPAARLTVAR